MRLASIALISLTLTVLATVLLANVVLFFPPGPGGPYYASSRASREPSCFTTMHGRRYPLNGALIVFLGISTCSCTSITHERMSAL